VVMRLFNSDGSPAALSGNGLRCFAQAIARHRGVDVLDIAVSTPAGIRNCSVRATGDPLVVEATVVMGEFSAGPAPETDDLMAWAGD